MRTLLATLLLLPALHLVGPSTGAVPHPSAPGPAVPDPGGGDPASDPVVPAGGVWPLQPVPDVVRAFDPPPTPWGRGHRGVDLAGSTGRPVYAALPGRVSHAAVLAGRGVVVVDHGPTRTTYEPVVAEVEVGARVEAGQRIGRLELAASHCLPTACLHWGWRRGEEYLDPLLLVGGGPVRLLPPGGLPGGLTPAGAPAGRHSAAGRW